MGAYSASNPPVEATTTQNTTQGDSPYIQVNLKLQRLMSGETNKNKNPIIRQIHSITERKVENLKAEKNQFRFRNGKVLDKGFPYHVHYTKNLGEFFMSEAVHNSNSQLLIPLNIDTSNFGYYNALNKQSPMKLNNKISTPTENDYKKGSYKRYFAKQSNDKNQSSFEVSKQDYKTSPLYNYVELKWYISGKRNYVYAQNMKEIRIASISIPNIERILSPFQWYRYDKDGNLSEADKIRRKLAGSCSLGPQYKTKEDCIAAGGFWLEGMMSNHMMNLSNYNTVNQFDGDSRFDSTMSSLDGKLGDGSGLLDDDGNYSGNNQISDEEGNLDKLC